MDGKITVSVKGILVAGLAALGLLAAYLVGANGGGPSLPAQAAATESGAESGAGTMRMVGAGNATVVPDQLTFSVGVTAKRVELDTALTESSGTMRTVLAELAKYGVKTADVQTTGLSMQPEYDYPNYGSPILTGYRVTQRAEVKVRDLSAGGKAIAAAVKAGGNGVRVGSIRLSVSDTSEALKQARDAAVAEATDKAQQYADSTGQALGQVLSIREISSPVTVVEQSVHYSGAMDRAVASMPIRAGKDKLAVRVQIVWSLSS